MGRGNQEKARIRWEENVTQREDVFPLSLLLLYYLLLYRIFFHYVNYSIALSLALQCPSLSWMLHCGFKRTCLQSIFDWICLVWLQDERRCQLGSPEATTVLAHSVFSMLRLSFTGGSPSSCDKHTRLRDMPKTAVLETTAATLLHFIC